MASVYTRSLDALVAAMRDPKASREAARKRFYQELVRYFEDSPFEMQKNEPVLTLKADNAPLYFQILVATDRVSVTLHERESGDKSALEEIRFVWSPTQQMIFWGMKIPRTREDMNAQDLFNRTLRAMEVLLVEHT